MTEKVKGKKPGKADVALDPALLDEDGLTHLVRRGLAADQESKTKNRVILGLIFLLGLSLLVNVKSSGNEPVIKLLGETSDGRIRPLPLLNDPIYTPQQILAWSERCVQSIYRLSFVDWRTTIQNESYCLSDGARSAFVESLRTQGFLDNLTAEHQGTVYAVPERATIRSSRLSPTGYTEWIVDVPYRAVLDGRRRAQLDVVMTMRIRRVSLTWREEGIWVDTYQISPKRGG